MIIGNGLISKLIEDDESLCFFASGVSNSKCIDPIEFKRELNLLNDAIGFNLPVVYFSTITVLQKEKTPYIEHKILMEKKVSEKEHLIVRLPCVISRNSKNHHFIKNIVNQIINGEVLIQKNSNRYLLHEDDISRELSCLLKNKERGAIEIVPKKPILVEDVIDKISNILKLNPKKIYISKKNYPNNYDFKNPLFLKIDYDEIIEKYLNN